MARSIATWLSFALLCAGAGCATHMTAVRPLPPEKEAEIKRVVAGRQAKLTLEGNPFDSRDVRLTGSSVRFLERDPARPEVDVGPKGHINTASNLGRWPEGFALLEELRAPR
jgi:hypothetical protein